MIAICFTVVTGAWTDVDADALDGYIQSLASDDSEALAPLYHGTSAAVYGLALSILKNTQDAEDVLQECYLNIYSAAPGYRSKGKPLAWMLTITRNLCMQKLRERKKRADMSLEDFENHLISMEGVTVEDRLILLECMRSLTDEERQIVSLHAVAGFKHREIASLLNLPLSTVLSKYHRAVNKLKKQLRKESGKND